MIESMFFFLTIVSILVFAYGLWARSPVVIALAGILFIGMGAQFQSDGFIENRVGFKLTEIDENITDINAVYSNLTAANDATVLMFRDLFFYGGFACFPIAFGVYYLKLNQKT